MSDVALEAIDSALARWGQTGREVVSVTEATDILLDVRLLVTEVLHNNQESEEVR